MIDSEQVSADLFNTARDPVAVQRLENIEGFEDLRRQRALLDVRLLFSWLYILATNRKDATVPMGRQQEIELPECVRSGMFPLPLCVLEARRNKTGACLVTSGFVIHGLVRPLDGIITTFDAPGAGTGSGQGSFTAAVDGLNPGGISDNVR